MLPRRVNPVLSRSIAIFALPIVLILVVWLYAPPIPAQRKTEVDLALVLAVDCSASVDNSEFDLQMQGLAQAFASREVVAAIGQGPLGRIAVIVVEWSGRPSQDIAVPWTIVSDAATARQVGRAISAAPRLSAGRTSISNAIEFSIYQLVSSPVAARRLVIDISGDGVNNSGERPPSARDLAIAAGITINGLTILNTFNILDIYFKDHVVGGPGNFVIVANDYGAYGRAIKRKLLREIKGIFPVS